MKKTIVQLALDIDQGSYQMGRAVGYEDVARTLLEKAGEFFKNDNDVLARVYRQLAQEIEETARDLRKENEANWQARSDALEELDKEEYK